MKDKAMTAIQEHMNKAGEGAPAWAVGEILLEIINTNPAAAELVEQDLENKDMSLEKCYETLKEYARKNQKGGSYYMSPKKTKSLICGFYGIPEGLEQAAGEKAGKPAAKVFDLADLL